MQEGNNQQESYIELAHRTSAPVEPCQARLKNFTTLSVLRDVLNDVRQLGFTADQLKRLIFYGKELAATPRSYIVLGENREAVDNEKMVELVHAGIGMLTEACEFLDTLRETIFEGKPLDELNLKVEVGDTFWYQAKACRTLGTTFEAEQARNIAKLRARYPDKFTEKDAIERDLGREREVSAQVGVDEAFPGTERTALQEAPDPAKS